ncbi:hypothetical protein QQS21_005197 [Conoideocrella luteorostrata]|uniref:AB hydrolase-1 domain-containing protein n=1 Tax=Conoideocrella luteorostrata TaxID=1105319 RepID=A0AAJ0CPU0_9HYPO|nr:hypothetical protein QQS21_005197 [Conoideocrella luteorostrata]
MALTTLPPVRTYKFPSAEETMRHPAFKSTVWALEPNTYGKLPVAKGRGGPYNIYWEVHGTGPTKLVLLMGLAGTITSWQIQTLYFGHTHGEKYSVLVLDNRGIGRSDKPLARYTTSEMALDAIEVIDHVGWTSPRQINLMGISLGGMISQEIACLMPERIQSLSLICTSSHVESGKSFPESAWERVKLFRPKSESQTIQDTALSIFVPEFLAAKDDFELPSPNTTPKCGPAKTADGEYPRFESNFQRFQSQELHKKHTPGYFTRQGFFCQLIAAAGHKKTSAQLKKMADEIGRDRILVMHGTRDKMLVVKNGERLIKAIEPGVGMIVEDLGHAPIFERSDWFNGLLDERLGVWAKL